jgi:hypothetical protein
MRGVRVAHLDAGGLGPLEQHLDQARPATHRLHVQPAPEAVLPAHHVGLPPMHEDPAETSAPHPGHGGARPADQMLGEIGVGEAFRDAVEVVAELRFRVGRHLDGGRFLVGEVGQDVAAEIDQTPMGEAEAPGGEE